jgi:hypothetical protein
MPAHTEEILKEKMGELKESLDRVVGHLEVCVGSVSGSRALAEIELQEEMAFPYLFYDWSQVLEKDLELNCPREKKREEKWKRFLNLAKCYQIVLREFF